ncbi:MAG TPA: (Fe-S)-binding protein [Clostridia bacterium]|mgnify:CR=1 FL=1
MDFFMTFILPILIVMGIAAILGFVLAFLGEKLEVKQDERVSKVIENLAGVNCGSCGYASCAAFAEALVSGNTTLDKCRPTNSDKKAIIKELLSQKKDA